MTDEPNLEQLYADFAPKGGSLKEILYDWKGLNEKLFFAINDIHGEEYDRTMQLISKTGDHDLFLYYFAALVIFALLALLIRKLTRHGGVKACMTGWVGVLTVLLVGYFATGIPVKIIKDEFSYKRPYYEYGAKSVVVLERLPPYKADQSFPSGHATFTTFMVTALWPVMPVLLRWMGVYFIGIMAWSRLAVGVHFPADVLAGILIGLIMTYFVRVLIYAFYRKVFKWNL